MRLQSFSILFGSLLISFNYVWINRIEVIKYDKRSYVLLNKWTGNHCVFIPDDDWRDSDTYYDLPMCIEPYEKGEITIP